MCHLVATYSGMDLYIINGWYMDYTYAHNVASSPGSQERVGGEKGGPGLLVIFNLSHNDKIVMMHIYHL